MTSENPNTHLSAEALDGLLIEFHAPAFAAARAHLEICLACAERVQHEQWAIQAFAMGTRQEADDAMQRLVMRPPAVPARTRWTFPGFALRPAPLAGLAATAAAVVFAVVIGAGLHGGHAAPASAEAARVASITARSDHSHKNADADATSRPAQPQSAETDEALLEGVDRELSRSVAGPLEPLSDPLQTQAESGSTQQN